MKQVRGIKEMDLGFQNRKLHAKQKEEQKFCFQRKNFVFNILVANLSNFFSYMNFLTEFILLKLFVGVLLLTYHSIHSLINLISI